LFRPPVVRALPLGPPRGAPALVRKVARRAVGGAAQEGSEDARTRVCRSDASPSRDFSPRHSAPCHSGSHPGARRRRGQRSLSAGTLVSDEARRGSHALRGPAGSGSGPQFGYAAAQHVRQRPRRPVGEIRAISLQIFGCAQTSVSRSVTKKRHRTQPRCSIATSVASCERPGRRQPAPPPAATRRHPPRRHPPPRAATCNDVLPGASTCHHAWKLWRPERRPMVNRGRCATSSDPRPMSPRAC